ncbi:MAG: AmmeMemoRadiSam system protein B [Deltaproteobacteria bacterium]|nr:AmmeMemoRadiSam system protein B [Candidatus Zymogenaceae bacterium]
MKRLIDRPARYGRIMLLVITAIAFGCSACGAEVREAAVAGMFYPADPDELADLIDGYLADAPDVAVSGPVAAVIAPHAGYIYSGAIAAAAYRYIDTTGYDTVIVIAPSHHLSFDGVSVNDTGSYETPLGRIPLDMELIEAIRNNGARIDYAAGAHVKEHAVEVQLPFLQRVLGDFELVPMVMGSQDYDLCVETARAIADAVEESGKRVLLVASTDLSHYHSHDEAMILDGVFRDMVIANNPAGLYDALLRGSCEACGAGPVISVMLAANRLGACDVIETDSGDSAKASGDYSRVVGYFSAVIAETDGDCPDPIGNQDIPLTDDDKKMLLTIARTAIECGLTGDPIPEFDVSSPALTQLLGAFVTLKNDNDLRGCIGYTGQDMPLYLVVMKMAPAAAFHDPRFFPVTEKELKDITIEISVLSSLSPISSTDDIEIGVHGLVIEKGYAMGLLLPQVPVEQGWDRDEYLKGLCRKAGLSSDAWMDDDVKLSWFTANVFSDEDF